jgi:hypothetical protein
VQTATARLFASVVGGSSDREQQFFGVVDVMFAAGPAFVLSGARFHRLSIGAAAVADAGVIQVSAAWLRSRRECDARCLIATRRLKR